MTRRQWTLRGGDAECGTVLVITSHADRLDTLASEIAAHGYYTFIAIPDAVPVLLTVTQFDLVVVMDDVAPADRDQLAPVAAKLLTLTAAEEAVIVERIRSRLGN
ncbi:MAG: hypothetical protein H0T42_11850 [Deltaproteobacteria bacterium]|nr:hypothetical protein [Deltaproteobacteria bacterium]